jgi:anaerobic selenocysteine-containing dehydrogenase
LQPIPGSDTALFVGIQKSLIERGKINSDFLAEYTENSQEIIDFALSISWETIETTCGISQTEIKTAGSMIAASTKVVFA